MKTYKMGTYVKVMEGTHKGSGAEYIARDKNDSGHWVWLPYSEVAILTGKVRKMKR